MPQYTKKEKEEKVREFLTFSRSLTTDELSKVIRNLTIIRDDIEDPNVNTEKIFG